MVRRAVADRRGYRPWTRFVEDQLFVFFIVGAALLFGIGWLIDKWKGR